MNGKSDKRRPGKQGAYEKGYDSIDWKKKVTKKDIVDAFYDNIDPKTLGKMTKKWLASE